MESRIRRICDAASHEFITSGYVQTQVQDIAGEAGLRPEDVYSCFTSKRDILDFILKMSIEPEITDADQQLPIGSAYFTGLGEEIKKAFADSRMRFREPMFADDPTYTFPRMLSDAYDVITQHAMSFLIIEANLEVFGWLGDFLREYRHEFTEQVHTYLLIFLSRGDIRPLHCPRYVAQLIVETLTWWGLRSAYDTIGDSQVLPEVARSVCMDNLLHAYGNSTGSPGLVEFHPADKIKGDAKR